MSSYTTNPLTALPELLSRDWIQALVLAETARACVPDRLTENLDSDWLYRHSGQPFTLLGLTSLAGVVLRDRLSGLTGLVLPTTLVFDYPSPEAVSTYLCERLLDSGRKTPETVPMPASSPVDSGAEPIAIVSMACRYPGGIISPEDLWRVVINEVDVTSGFPHDVSKTSRYFLSSLHRKSLFL